MEVYERLDDLVDLIEGARGVPLSDSCVVNRTIALELLEAVRALMPASLRDAATILADRDDVLEDAAREAQAQVGAARDEAGSIIEMARTDAAAFAAQAQSDAEQVRAQARLRRSRRDTSGGGTARLVRAPGMADAACPRALPGSLPRSEHGALRDGVPPLGLAQLRARGRQAVQHIDGRGDDTAAGGPPAWPPGSDGAPGHDHRQ